VVYTVKEVVVKTNAGKIGFAVGFFAFWGWSIFGNVLNTNLVRQSLYDGLRASEEIAQLSILVGMPAGSIVSILISVAAFIVAAVTGTVFILVAGKKTVLVDDGPADFKKDDKITTCPFCAEIIKVEAKVCRYCGKDLPEETPEAEGGISTGKQSDEDVNELDLLDENGNTKLMVAAAKGDKTQVISLLSDGANPNVKDRNGMTAKVRAKNRGNTEIVGLLEDAESNISSV